LNIVAIGGGNVGDGETVLLDRELVRIALEEVGPGRPVRALFIPTASGDSEEYIDSVTAAYEVLGCEVDSLRLWSVHGQEEALEKIEAADLVYVGGGNTKAMLERWRETEVDKMLERHLAQGKPVGGVSAGAICWFRVGNSDWPQFEGVPGVMTARLDCLGFVDLVLCPHASTEEFRLGDFRQMMRGETGVGLALDDNCAIQVRNTDYRILAAQPGAVAHRIEWRNGVLDEVTLAPHEDFRPLASL
jgi:dipeptidase E